MKDQKKVHRNVIEMIEPRRTTCYICSYEHDCDMVVYWFGPRHFKDDCLNKLIKSTDNNNNKKIDSSFYMLMSITKDGHVIKKINTDDANERYQIVKYDKPTTVVIDTYDDKDWQMLGFSFRYIKNIDKENKYACKHCDKPNGSDDGLLMSNILGGSFFYYHNDCFELTLGDNAVNRTFICGPSMLICTGHRHVICKNREDYGKMKESTKSDDNYISLDQYTCEITKNFYQKYVYEIDDINEINDNLDNFEHMGIFKIKNNKTDINTNADNNNVICDKVPSPGLQISESKGKNDINCDLCENITNNNEIIYICRHMGVEYNFHNTCAFSVYMNRKKGVKFSFQVLCMLHAYGFLNVYNFLEEKDDGKKYMIRLPLKVYYEDDKMLLNQIFEKNNLGYNDEQKNLKFFDNKWQSMVDKKGFVESNIEKIKIDLRNYKLGKYKLNEITTKKGGKCCLCYIIINKNEKVHSMKFGNKKLLISHFDCFRWFAKDIINQCRIGNEIDKIVFDKSTLTKFFFNKEEKNDESTKVDKPLSWNDRGTADLNELLYVDEYEN